MGQLKTWFRERTKRTLIRILRALGEEAGEMPRVVLPKGNEVASTNRRYLAAVAIMWNEGPDLKEWIEFHRLVGIEHIYLYDDGSSDGSAEIVRPYVDSGYVTYIPWSKFTNNISQQRLAYAHALSTFGRNWRWMAFIDLDEYLFPVADESLVESLKRYEDLPAIAVPWHMYGTCGHETRPDGLIIENFTQRVPFPSPHKYVWGWKSIVDPSQVGVIYSPHFFTLLDGKSGSYTEDRLWVFNKQPEGWEGIRSNVFRINHYFTKSREDFERRRSSGRNVSLKHPETSRERIRKLAKLIDESEVSEVDELILRYVPALRRILAMEKINRTY